MALIYRTYSCDSGGDAEEPHSFEILIERDRHPAFCSICGSPVEGEPIPAKIAIGGSAAARAVDMTYNLVEQSSIERAQLAEEAGLSPAQARNLKVTDMHDNLREGDVAAKLPPPVANPVGQFMQEAARHGINYGFQSAGTPGSGSGSTPMTGRSGARVSGPAQDVLQVAQGPAGTAHQQTRARMMQAGQINPKGTERVRT